jgi:hypothetical protein
MKRLGIYTVVTALLSVGSIATANAQSKFEGAYGQLGVGYENVSPSFTSSGLTVSGLGTLPINTTVSNQGSFVGVVGVGYMAELTKDFLLGLGAEYSPFAGQSGNYSYGINGVGTQTGTYQKQNSYNVFLSPATPIGQDGLLYGKVGFTGASIKATESGSSNTTNYTGYSLGVGYKQIIQGGLYAFGEVNYANLGNTTNTYSGVVLGRTYSYSNTSSANTYNAVVGIGYKF